MKPSAPCDPSPARGKTAAGGSSATTTATPAPRPLRCKQPAVVVGDELSTLIDHTKRTAPFPIPFAICHVACVLINVISDGTLREIKTVRVNPTGLQTR